MVYCEAKSNKYAMHSKKIVLTWRKYFDMCSSMRNETVKIHVTWMVFVLSCNNIVFTHR